MTSSRTESIPPSTECDARPRGESASFPQGRAATRRRWRPPHRRRRVQRGSQVDSQSSYRPSFLPENEVTAALASSSSKGATRHDSKGRTSNPFRDFFETARIDVRKARGYWCFGAIHESLTR